MESLKLNYNDLTHFKEKSLPDTLTNLEATNNKFNEIKNIPDSVKILNLSNNLITNIVKLPNNLKKLILQNNKITSLVNIDYPNTMTELEMEYNYLESIPLNLPESLKGLFLDNNKISVLNNCPPNLEVLSCDSNQIHTIENVSKNLLELHISDNQLTKLQNLSNTIEDLHIKNNLLKELKIIPKNCTSLDVRNNLIEIVKVTKCFKNLSELSILGNKIKDVDSLIYKLNRLEVFSDIIPEEESSNSESEIDFDDMKYNSSNDSEQLSDVQLDDLDIPKFNNENNEVTADDILNYSKQLNDHSKKKNKSK